MEIRDPGELLAAASNGRPVYVVKGTPRETLFQFDRFAEVTRRLSGLAAVYHTTERRISFPGGGSVTFVTIGQVRDGCMRGVDNPLVAAAPYYWHHELDDHLPTRHERVDG